MKHAVILSAARTPIGSLGGVLAGVPAVELGATAIRAAVQRAGIGANDVDEVILGMVLQGGTGQAPARQAAIAAGIPDTKSAWTINKVCSSGLKAVMEAAGSIALDENRVVAAGGMENMSQAPYVLAHARDGYRYGNAELIDMMVHDGLWDPYSRQHMGMCAEVCATENGITREQQDAFAIESYRRANQSIAAGLFKEEITPVVIKSRKGDTVVDTDEEPGRAKPDKIPTLKPAFKPDGTVTAANASSINDGGAALTVACPEWAAQQGVEYVDASSLAALSDVISLHVPLTPETKYIIRRETLSLMKPGAILINVSRGALVDTTALIEALKSGRLGGVALDVYEEEEGVFYEDLSGQVLHDDELARLLTFPNVLITSHQAFLTREALSDIARTTVANLEALATGKSFVEGSVLT